MVTKFPEEGIWFTSDTHFNHSKIIEFCKRPYSSIEEHDAALIKNWNDLVSPEDTVFHLGDFCYGGAPKWKEIISQLNGHIILIRGNHDDKNLQASLYPLFEDVVYQARLLIGNRTVYLNHFPFLCFAHADPNTYKDAYSIQLFGHVHSGPYCTTEDKGRMNYLYPTQYDVGVDNNDYRPISWQQVKEIINKQLQNERDRS